MGRREKKWGMQPSNDLYDPQGHTGHGLKTFFSLCHSKSRPLVWLVQEKVRRDSSLSGFVDVSAERSSSVSMQAWS